MNDRSQGPQAPCQAGSGHAISRLLSCLLAASVFLALGCVGPKAAVEISPQFPSGIDRITLVPAVDARWDKTIDNDYSKLATRYAASRFKSRKYQLEIAPDPIFAADLLRTNDLATVGWDLLRQANLPSDRWVLLVTVEHVTRFVTLGTEVMTEVRGALLDTHSQSIVWRGVGKGDFRIGIVFSGLVDNEALKLALLRLAQSLPRKGDNPADYDPGINSELTPPRLTLPSVQIGMRQEEIEQLYGKKGRVHSYPEGETWTYHENMAVMYAPGSQFFYKPDISVFHFDRNGILRKYHLGTFEGDGA